MREKKKARAEQCHRVLRRACTEPSPFCLDMFSGGHGPPRTRGRRKQKVDPLFGSASELQLTNGESVSKQQEP